VLSEMRGKKCRIQGKKVVWILPKGDWPIIGVLDPRTYPDWPVIEALRFRAGVTGSLVNARS
jgi:hypothetical protein